MKFLKNILSFFIISVCCTIPIQALDTLTFSSIENSAFTNFAFTVISKAYESEGIQISINPLPAKRALKTANYGKEVDGELFRISGIEKKYKNLIPIEVPLLKSQWVVYSKIKDIKINGWESLKPYIIGIRRGIMTTQKGTQGMSTITVNHNEQLFKLLEKNRAEVIVISKINADKYYDKKRHKDIKLIKQAVSTIPVYHYLHKKHSSLVPHITKGMKKLEHSGFIEEMRKKFY